jgi:hypothetical protein
MSEGKDWQTSFVKTTGAAAYTAGRWYNTFTLGGTPSAGSYTGSLAAVALTNANAGALPYGGDVSTAIKHMLSLEVVGTAATAVPSVLMLVDLLMYYNAIDMDSAARQALTNIVTLPRYTDGNGVQMFLEATATTGTGTPNLYSGLSYTNTTPASDRTIPGTVRCTSAAIVPHLLLTGTAQDNYGPFLPLASGDLGVKSVEYFQLSAGTGAASTACLVLCKPLLTIPMVTASVGNSRNYVFDMPTFPRIYDGACLAFLLRSGGAVATTTSFWGQTSFVWG